MGSYQTKFSRALLTGVFAGFVASVLCVIYTVIYRERTNFQPADIINVSTIIFGVNLLFLVIGMIYYGFIRLFKKGDLIFLIVFILLTIYCLWQGQRVHRSDDHLLNMEFHQLLLAMLISLGIGAIAIPFLYHSKKFEEYVL